MKHTELLAPAGDFSCLTAAFNAGADAVYLAGKQFGARAFANNFEEEELLAALDYAHLFSKKIYLTLNTLIKESEFASVIDYLTPYYNRGLDGIIIQDLGLIPLLRREFPELELHASTQMTVNNYRSAKWLKEQGLCRVVPSRELSLIELKEIKEKADIEVEAFIHGAMCYGYSGQCLFSSFLGGRSGNRGRCAQPCRLPYQVNNQSLKKNRQKEIYPLSLKDLCSLPYIYDLLDVGIDSFKIEGRMKSPEYVAGVTSVYRKYIDYYYNGKRPDIDKKDYMQLSHLYIRSEMKDGYFMKHNGKDMVSLSSPSYQGCDDALVEKLHEKYCKHSLKLPISGSLNLFSGSPAKLIVQYQDYYVEKNGDIVQTAQNRPLSKEDVLKQIKKTGNSLFEYESLQISMDDAIFMPVKKLNELRREVLDELKDIILASNYRTKNLLSSVHDNVFTKTSKKNCNPLLRISITTKEQWNAILNSNIEIDRVYVPSDLFYLNEADFNDILLKKKRSDMQIYLSMPRIIRKRDDEYLLFVKKIAGLFDGVMVKNLESLCFLLSIGYDKPIITDSMIYTWNKSALTFINHFRDEFTYPLELSLAEIRLLQDYSGEYIVYGRTPMMVSANCIRKSTDSCTHTINDFAQSLTDRYKKELPVYTNCIHCYNEIYNAVSMSLHKEINRLMNKNFYKFRLDFTNEDAQTTLKIASYFSNCIKDSGYQETYPLKEYTLGHYKEGAI